MSALDCIVAVLPQLAAAAPLPPLVAAAGIAAQVLAGRAQGDAGEGPTARMAVGGALAALVLLLAAGAAALARGAPGHIVLGTWLESGELRLPLSFALDALGLSVAALIALIALLTLRFSVNYLHREPGYHRFFLAMSLFVSGMLALALAGNAVLAFAGWELAGVASWLLIGYAYERPAATGNALYAFVVNRIGDAGFVLGIALCALWLGSVEWPALAAGGQLDRVAARLLLLGFLIAALAKSAQLPFAPWIGRALEGPTPSSAIFYGAVMVHAGVFLLLRLEPLLVQVPDMMAGLALIGLATALYGWLSGLAQMDAKSALLFGTVTQVGLMFLECGLGWFGLAAWHLGLHAAWRSWQFLRAPSYMHLLGGTARQVPGWLARRQWLYTAALQRFWLDPLAQSALARPVGAVAEDVRAFDDRVLARLVGMPEEVRAAASAEDEVIRGRGLAGRALAWLADRMQRLETRLLMQGGGGAAGRLLRRAGDYLLALEALLEQPRYLLLLVLATFAVIL